MKALSINIFIKQFNESSETESMKKVSGKPFRKQL